MEVLQDDAYHKECQACIQRLEHISGYGEIMSDWINRLEELAFPGCHSDYPRPDEFAINFLKKTTLLDPIMQKKYDEYVKRIVGLSPGKWNDHRIKGFLISDYPIAQLISI